MNALELRGLRAGYDRIEVLHGVDLAVEAGTVTAVLGANGSGRTTMLSVVVGLHPASAGAVLMAGHDVTDAGAAGAKVDLEEYSPRTKISMMSRLAAQNEAADESSANLVATLAALSGTKLTHLHRTSIKAADVAVVAAELRLRYAVGGPGETPLIVFGRRGRAAKGCRTVQARSRGSLWISPQEALQRWPPTTLERVFI